MAFTWHSNIIGLDKSLFLMNIKGLLPFVHQLRRWQRFLLLPGIVTELDQYKRWIPHDQVQKEWDRQTRQWVRFMKKRDLRMCHPQTATVWRNADLVFFFLSLLKTFHVHDAILTLCDDVTIVFSQINRKKDESEALCLLLLDAVWK